MHPAKLTRRGFLAAGGAVAAGFALSACSDETSKSADTNGAITVKHVFGETTVNAPPKKIVCAGYTEHDYLLALGIIPAAVTDWYGGFPFATWPWATAKLGAATPEVLNLTGGLMVDKIASLKPDLILATDAGLDQDSYNKLSGIAPTIAQSGMYAFFQPWKDQAKAIGQAVFKTAEMQTLVKGVDDRFAAAASANTVFNGKKAVFLQGALQDGQAIAYRPGYSTEFLTALKLTVPSELDGYAKNDQQAYIPADRLATALGDADVLIWGTESDEDAAALKADPTIANLNATRLNRNIFAGNILTGAINFSSPLSLPYVADNLVPQLARALR